MTDFDNREREARDRAANYDMRQLSGREGFNAGWAARAALDARGLELDRLREGMAARGFIVGRNPEGVDDSVEATLLVIDDLRAALDAREEPERWTEADEAAWQSLGVAVEDLGTVIEWVRKVGMNGPPVDRPLSVPGAVGMAVMRMEASLDEGSRAETTSEVEPSLPQTTNGETMDPSERNVEGLVEAALTLLTEARRRALHGAPNNPPKISEDAERRLNVAISATHTVIEPPAMSTDELRAMGLWWDA